MSAISKHPGRTGMRSANATRSSASTTDRGVGLDRMRGCGAAEPRCRGRRRGAARRHDVERADDRATDDGAAGADDNADHRPRHDDAADDGAADHGRRDHRTGHDDQPDDRAGDRTASSTDVLHHLAPRVDHHRTAGDGAVGPRRHRVRDKLPELHDEREIVFPLVGHSQQGDGFNDCTNSCTTFHKGIDLLAEKLQPVVSAVDGVVAAVLDHPTAGVGVVIRDADGYEYRLYHLNNDSPFTDDDVAAANWRLGPGVNPGASVSAGQLIGFVGDSGNAELAASRLYFEIRRPDGTSIDPSWSLDAAVDDGWLCAPETDGDRRVDRRERGRRGADRLPSARRCGLRRRRRRDTRAPRRHRRRGAGRPRPSRRQPNLRSSPWWRPHRGLPRSPCSARVSGSASFLPHRTAVRRSRATRRRARPTTGGRPDPGVPAPARSTSTASHSADVPLQRGATNADGAGPASAVSAPFVAWPSRRRRGT